MPRWLAGRLRYLIGAAVGAVVLGGICAAGAWVLGMPLQAQAVRLTLGVAGALGALAGFVALAQRRSGDTAASARHAAIEIGDTPVPLIDEVGGKVGAPPRRTARLCRYLLAALFGAAVVAAGSVAFLAVHDAIDRRPSKEPSASMADGLAYVVLPVLAAPVGALVVVLALALWQIVKRRRIRV